jgi:hypothetical protein
MANILTLEYTGGSVSLTDQEVFRVEVITNQRYYLKRLLSYQPVLYYHGDPWHEIYVDVILAEPATAGHLSTLRALTGNITFTMYHQNGNPIECFYVKIDPNVELKYNAGSPEAGTTVRLHFWEALQTATPAVEVTYLPIGRV